MTYSEFIDNIIKAYVDARPLTYGNFNNQIKRGKSHSISSKAEDLFAYLIAKEINQPGLKYYVDKPISVRIKENSKKKSIQPDLFILNDQNVITHYFDIKMDLGWQRELQPYLQEKDDRILNIRGKKASYKSGGKDIDVFFAEDLVYQIVILSGENINSKKLNGHREFCTPYETLKLYVLTSGAHLNIYDEKNREKLRIHDEEFGKLMQDTRSLIQ